jgi:hypothetical protein
MAPEQRMCLRVLDVSRDRDSPALICCTRRTVHRSEHPMLDIIMLAIALVFFVLSVGYTVACDRL